MRELWLMFADSRLLCYQLLKAGDVPATLE